MRSIPAVRAGRASRRAGLLSLALAWAGAMSGAAASADIGSITSYTIQLQNVGRDLDRLAGSDYDLLVVEPTVEGADGKRRLLNSEEVGRLHTKPDGGRRVVLAYLSVGEAEVYRDYWRPEWSSAPPSFLIAENCQWHGNHLVRFWEPEWQKLLFGSPEAELQRLLRAGFDGVSLDRIDVFEDIEHSYPQARQQMVSLVKDLSDAARAVQPGSIVMAHNAESLLSEVSFRRAVDAVLKEDLLYGIAATGRANTRAAVDWSQKQLALLAREGKPVLVAEYLTDRDQAEITEATLLDRDFLPGIFPRALDGSDPFRPAKALEETVGTPERSAATCQGVWPRGASQ